MEKDSELQEALQQAEAQNAEEQDKDLLAITPSATSTPKIKEGEVPEGPGMSISRIITLSEIIDLLI